MKGYNAERMLVTGRNNKFCVLTQLLISQGWVIEYSVVHNK